MSDEERARAVALLEANHEFPTEYSLSVIARTGQDIEAQIVGAAFGDTQERPPGSHETRPSSGGKYVSHRLTFHVPDAEAVLLVYARLRAIDGVVTIL